MNMDGFNTPVHQTPSRMENSQNFLETSLGNYSAYQVSGIAPINSFINDQQSGFDGNLLVSVANTMMNNAPDPLDVMKMLPRPKDASSPTNVAKSTTSKTQEELSLPGSPEPTQKGPEVAEVEDADSSKKPHSCSLCAKSYVRRDSLTMHQRSHVMCVNQNCLDEVVQIPKKEGAGCKVCKKSYPKSFLNNGKVKCEHQGCEKFFSSTAVMRKHITQAHGELKNCDKCDKENMSPSALLLHCQREHGAEGGYRCDFCSRVFSSKRHLDGHLRKHGKHGEQVDVTTIKCGKCGKLFMYQNNMRIHEKKCTGTATAQGDSSMKCKVAICGKVFQDSRALSNHMDAVHKRMQFKCISCGKAYSYRSNLSRHIKECQKSATQDTSED